jgi:hypothetical protein
VRVPPGSTHRIAARPELCVNARNKAPCTWGIRCLGAFAGMCPPQPRAVWQFVRDLSFYRLEPQVQGALSS